MRVQERESRKKDVRCFRGNGEESVGGTRNRFVGRRMNGRVRQTELWEFAEEKMETE